MLLIPNEKDLLAYPCYILGERESDKTVLLLHGAGEINMPPPKFKKVLEGLLDIDALEKKDYLTVVPICSHHSDHDIWNPDKLMTSLAYLSHRGKQKKKRYAAVGYSMGSRGVFDLICGHAQDISAACLISGYNCYLRSPQIKSVPLWFHHGLLDQTVPIGETAKTVEAIRGIRENDEKLKDIPCQFSVYQRAGHGLFQALLGKTDLFDWLAQF